MLKRIISCAAAVCLAASLVPATALAVPAESFQSDEARVVAASEARAGTPVSVDVSLPSSLTESPEGGYADNPFQVTATVTASEDVSNVSASISMDSSFLMLDEAFSDTVVLGSFAAGADKGVAWTVRAIPQSSAATADVTIKLRGGGSLISR